MKKICWLALVFTFVFSTFCNAQALNYDSGIKKLTIDQEGYKTYLGKISYATPITLEDFSANPDKIKENIGKKVVVLGFATNSEESNKIKSGYLKKSIAIDPDSETNESKKYVKFVSKEASEYKPFEIYQVTGILQKMASDTQAKFIINANFAEPQGESSKVLYEPDLSKEIKSIPEINWSWLYPITPTDQTASATMSVPDKLKSLENKFVKIRAWFHNDNTLNQNSLKRNISCNRPDDAKCACYAPEPKSCSNSATIILKKKLPAQVVGGLFIGKLIINPKEDWTKSGFFTIKDGILALPNSYYLSVENSPKTNGE